MLGVARFPDGLPEPQWLSDAAVCQLIPRGCEARLRAGGAVLVAKLERLKNFWDKC